MRLAASNGATCDDNACVVPAGASFTLSVEIMEAPTEGYVGAQAFIDFGTHLSYHPTANPDGPKPMEEMAWPDCSPVVVTRSQLSASTVTHGCLTGLLPPQPISSYVGTYVNLAYTCSAGSSSTLVRLVPFGDPFAGTQGSKFVLPGGETVTAKVGEVTIDCVAPIATPMPTSTVPPAVTPTATPTIAVLVGDANCDGVVNALDAAFILQFAAGLLAALPCPQGGDVNGDGVSNALDAALVLQFSAGLLGSLPP